MSKWDTFMAGALVGASAMVLAVFIGRMDATENCQQGRQKETSALDAPTHQKLVFVDNFGAPIEWAPRKKTSHSF